MADFKNLIALISDTIDSFLKDIPGIQKQMLDDILIAIKKLDTNDDKIKVAGSNLKILTQIQSRLQNILLNPDYLKSVKEYASKFNDVVSIQNDYFKSVESKFKPPQLTSEIKKQAVASVVNQLTENGLNANVVDKVSNLLRQAVTTGGSYSTLNKQLTDFLINNESSEGQLLRYTKQISTDAINQFSGQYTQLVSSDLGFEWFRYSGTNIETSRPFCLACTDRKYFHISQLPKVLKGQFEEFKKYDGKINKKTDLPDGMIPGTDVSNFMVNRGGYNCGHQWRPVSEELVPDDIKRKTYSSEDYRLWATANGKEIPALATLKVQAPKPAADETPQTQINLSNKQIRNIYDVSDILKQQKDKISDWFNNTSFKSLRIETNPKNNGSSDMNGNIWLSPEKARLFSEALEKIKNGVALEIDNEKAIATFWHEVWHNKNKNSDIEPLTDKKERYMELGNEFVARKTLDEFYERFGTKPQFDSLKTNRGDTGYNTMVMNYDRLIDSLGASRQSVIDYMKDRMTNGSYGNVKNYLIDALIQNNISRSYALHGVRDAIKLNQKDFADKYPIR